MSYSCNILYTWIYIYRSWWINKIHKIKCQNQRSWSWPTLVLQFLLNLCHYFASYLQVFANLFLEFASPNFHREFKKCKDDPTLRSPPIWTENFEIGISSKYLKAPFWNLQVHQEAAINFWTYEVGPPTLS